MIEGYYDALSPLYGIITVLFIVLILALVCQPRKSKQYRKMLTDMFVVGKIKQLAKEEDIDLLTELKEFAKFMKERKIDEESLDSTIERELQEKIAKVAIDDKDKTVAKK